MKRFLFGWVALGISAIALGSCESMIDVLPQSRVGDIDEKLVIHAYLSPSDTLIRISVTQSLPMFKEVGENFTSVVTDAEVTLSNSRYEVVLPYNEQYHLYALRHERTGGIIPGETYRLVVKSNGRTAEATTTIPIMPPPIESYSIDTSYRSSLGIFDRRDTTLTVQFTWRDPPGANNFYRVEGKAVLLMDYWEYVDDGNYAVKRGRFNVPFYWDSGFGFDEFQSDLNRDGWLMESPLGRVNVRRPYFFSEDGGIEYAERPNELRSITVSLMHTDEHYFRYHRSVAQHEQASDNPFAEPVLLYSNVKGGLGVFASYNSFSIDIKP